MFTFNEVVKASSIWENAKDHIDYGQLSGAVRGYTIEVYDKFKNLTFWLSTEYTFLDPEKYFNDDFHLWMYEEHGWTPTGKISFRGYGFEEYSMEERDTFVNTISDEEALKLIEEYKNFEEEEDEME